MADYGYDTTFKNCATFNYALSPININENKLITNYYIKINLPKYFSKYISYSIMNWKEKHNDDINNLIYLVLDLFFLCELPNRGEYYINYLDD